MFPFITQDMLIIALAALILLVLILWIVVIVCQVKLHKINKNADNGNLAAAITQYYQKFDQEEAQLKEQMQHILLAEKKFKNSVQKVGMLRYKALDNIGSDQSYSVALLDEYDDGFVLTGIYSRDAASVTYLKPIQKGQSAIILSDEETQAMALAEENYQRHMA